MSQLTEKILRSGLVDKHTAALMEKYGLLEEGSSEKVNDDALKGATKEQLEKLAEDLAVEAEREFALKETMLDLNQLRWPVTVVITSPSGLTHVDSITALVDRMGRYYFRPRDVSMSQLTLGHELVVYPSMKKETIVEVTELFAGDQVAAIQVSVAG